MHSLKTLAGNYLLLSGNRLTGCNAITQHILQHTSRAAHPPFASSKITATSSMALFSHTSRAAARMGKGMRKSGQTQERLAGFIVSTSTQNVFPRLLINGMPAAWRPRHAPACSRAPQGGLYLKADRWGETAHTAPEMPGASRAEARHARALPRRVCQGPRTSIRRVRKHFQMPLA